MSVVKEEVKKFINFLVHNRVQLSLMIFLLLLFEDIFEGIRPNEIDNFHDHLGLIGLLLVLGGVALRSWAAGIIHKGDSLATTGPYALMRHPLYIGSLLMALGFSTIIGDDENIWFILGMATVIYLPKIRQEEFSLAKKFGEEWRIYCEHTSIFFPKSFPRDIHSNWSFAQCLCNREYYAFLISLFALVVLELWADCLIL